MCAAYGALLNFDKIHNGEILMPYCTNCGSANTVEPAKDVDGDPICVFYEYGEYNNLTGNYDDEGSLDVDFCTNCNHEQIDISSQTGDLRSKRRTKISY